MLLDTVDKSLLINMAGSAGGAPTLITEYPCNYVIDPDDAHTLVYGTCVYCWDARKGNAPHVGPALNATVPAPTQVAGPHMLVDGLNRLYLERYGASVGRYTNAAGVNPISSTADLLVALTMQMPYVNTGSPEYVLGNISGANKGWVVFVNDTNTKLAFYVSNGAGGVFTVLSDTVAAGSIVTAFFVMHESTTLYAKINHSAPTSTAITVSPFGGIDTLAFQQGYDFVWGAGLGMVNNSGIQTAMAWSAEDGYANWSADSWAMLDEYVDVVTGVFETTGLGDTTRDSTASWLGDKTGGTSRRYFIASVGLPRAGDPGLLRVGPAITNEVYNNINPAATTGWTKAGDVASTLTRVSDSVALATVDEPDGDTVDGECWGPYVLKLDNSAGAAAAYAYSGAATGDTDDRSYQVIARISAGAGASMGSRDSSSGTYTSHAAIPGGGTYTHVLAQAVTPGDTDEYFCIEAPAACVVYFVAAQREKGPVCTSVVPNWATAATADRDYDFVPTVTDIVNTNTRLTATIIPLHWASTDIAVDNTIIDTDGGDLVVRYTATGWESYDGTNTLTAAYAHAAYEEVEFVLGWVTATWSLDVEGTTDTEVYVGAWTGGVLQVDGQLVVMEQGVSFALYDVPLSGSAFFVSWVDHEDDTVEPPESDTGEVGGGADIEVVPAPPVDHSRQVLLLNVYCTDTAGGVETIVKLDDGGTQYVLYRAVLEYQETLSWSIHTGWVVTDAEGCIKTSDLLPGYDAQADAHKVYIINKDAGRSELVIETATEYIDDYFPDGNGWLMNPAGYNNISFTFSATSITVDAYFYVQATNDVDIDDNDCTWVDLYGFRPDTALTDPYYVGVITISDTGTAQWDFDGLRVNRVRLYVVASGSDGTIKVSVTRSV